MATGMATGVAMMKWSMARTMNVRGQGCDGDREGGGDKNIGSDGDGEDVRA